MSRAQRNRRLGNRKGGSATAPAGNARPATGGVTRRTGTETPDPKTESPVVPADPKARVLKTRS